MMTITGAIHCKLNNIKMMVRGGHCVCRKGVKAKTKQKKNGKNYFKIKYNFIVVIIFLKKLLAHLTQLTKNGLKA